MIPRAGRLLILAALAFYGITCLRTPEAGRLLDSVDLAIHETGHIVFAPFGEVVMFLGGTIMQLLMPSVFVAYFWRERDAFAVSVCLWWVAQNFWNISVYVADARAQELPLVGGGEHDWAYLLGRAGWLGRDTIIAREIHGVGVMLFVVALAVGVVAALRVDPSDDPTAAAPAASSTHGEREAR